MLTQAPATNVVDKYSEHKNAYDVEYYKHNPEYLIALSLQRHNITRNFAKIQQPHYIITEINMTFSKKLLTVSKSSLKQTYHKCLKATSKKMKIIHIFQSGVKWQ